MRDVPRVPPFDRPATYEDLLKLPDHLVAEIVNGELHASARPAPRHALAGSVIGGLLVPPYFHGRGGPGGWWVLYEPELHLGPDVLVPDWAGWRRERMPALPEAAYFSQAPDWVCETLSPSTASLHRAWKLATYARERVPHAWLIDPIARTLEVLGLVDGRYSILAVHAGSETVRAVPFVEAAIDLPALWVETPRKSVPD
jgi:Uma2 family endonuclease